MLIQILYLAAGLLLVIKGGDLFVDSSVHISRRLHIPRIVVGGTIVSLATTVPELVVSATASYMGDSGIAVGNAVGSAIANIGLIVGVVAVLTPVVVDLADFRARSLWMLGSAILVIIFSWDLELPRTLGLILFAVALVYLAVDCIGAIRKRKTADETPDETPLTKSLMTFALGAVMVGLGSRLLVTSGIQIASALGIPSVIIGLSIIAVGTSLPELVTAVTAARKGVPDLSIGNIIGANVLNLSMITGISAVIRPLSLLPFTRNYSFPWLMVFVGLMILMIGREGKIDKREGCILLALYFLYIAGLIVFPMIGRV
ncbi:MAG: calcium/sodium antiporter [Candidatus Omnitrophota bacterium]|nr:calcium/sodium antiporter [Candidatus Omnitrophota bacterium]